MRAKFFFTITMCLSLYIVSAQTNKEAYSFTETDRIVGLSKLWMEVKNNYVYYDQLTFDWDSLYAAALPEVRTIEDPVAYNRYLQKMCVKLGDAHTEIRYDFDINDQYRVRPVPIEAKVFGKKLYVNNVLSSALEEKGIVKGVEIVKINDKIAYDYAIEEVMPYISYSTPQWQIFNTFCTFELTKRPTKDKMTFQFKDKQGKMIDLIVENKKEIKWDKQKETYQYEILEDNIGYLKITSFNDQESIRKFNEIYDQILPSDALIIDLRDNTGGNSNFADYILRHLSTKPIKTNQWSSRMYIPTNASWGIENEWYMQGAVNMYPVSKEIYTKPVMILTNAGTYSSAEDFCSVFKGMNRGKHIGTTTGGSTGNPIYVKLVKDIASTIICTRKVLTPTGETFVGIGLKPDVEIEETETDFLNNKDQVLAYAVKAIKIF